MRSIRAATSSTRTVSVVTERAALQGIRNSSVELVALFRPLILLLLLGDMIYRTRGLTFSVAPSRWWSTCTVLSIYFL
jgi:hypothetical protein